MTMSCQSHICLTELKKTRKMTVWIRTPARASCSQLAIMHWFEQSAQVLDEFRVVPEQLHHGLIFGRLVRLRALRIRARQFLVVRVDQLLDELHVSLRVVEAEAAQLAFLVFED